jgi:hypothetical protein
MTITPTYTGIHLIRFKNNVQTQTYTLSNWQLEEGTTATPFKPYSYGPMVKGNLIPDFEDPRWVFPTVTKVLGKDYIHSDYVSGGGQGNDIIINVLPYTSYATNFSFGNANGNHRFRVVDIDTGGFILNTVVGTFNSGNRSKVLIRLEGNGSVGGFDFIKPQLYQLDSFQGTINGAPTKQLDAPKRKLYAKR